jgi:hypothetical protein
MSCVFFNPDICRPAGLSDVHFAQLKGMLCSRVFLIQRLACRLYNDPSTSLSQIRLTIHLNLTTNIAFNIQYLLLKLNLPNPLPTGLGQYVQPCHITNTIINYFASTRLCKWNRQSVPKHHTTESNPKVYTQHIR